jgi:hypothetical protein
MISLTQTHVDMSKNGWKPWDFRVPYFKQSSGARPRLQRRNGTRACPRPIYSWSEPQVQEPIGIRDKRDNQKIEICCLSEQMFSTTFFRKDCRSLPLKIRLVFRAFCLVKPWEIWMVNPLPLHCVAADRKLNFGDGSQMGTGTDLWPSQFWEHFWSTGIVFTPIWNTTRKHGLVGDLHIGPFRGCMGVLNTRMRWFRAIPSSDLDGWGIQKIFKASKRIKK